MESLPTIGPSCSLNDLELREQLARYRVLGDRAEVLDWTAGRRTIRIAGSVPESLVAKAIEVERACCPFFELSWDSGSRRLTIGVETPDQVPALDALTYALGLMEPARSG